MGLSTRKFGEQTAQACAMAWFRQLPHFDSYRSSVVLRGEHAAQCGQPDETGLASAVVVAALQRDHRLLFLVEGTLWV
jgi:hypothetical protein